MEGALLTARGSDGGGAPALLDRLLSVPRLLPGPSDPPVPDASSGRGRRGGVVPASMAVSMQQSSAAPDVSKAPQAGDDIFDNGGRQTDNGVHGQLAASNVATSEHDAGDGHRRRPLGPGGGRGPGGGNRALRAADSHEETDTSSWIGGVLLQETQAQSISTGRRRLRSSRAAVDVKLGLAFNFVFVDGQLVRVPPSNAAMTASSRGWEGMDARVVKECCGHVVGPNQVAGPVRSSPCRQAPIQPLAWSTTACLAASLAWRERCTCLAI
jgi:hypothetical protein